MKNNWVGGGNGWPDYLLTFAIINMWASTTSNENTVYVCRLSPGFQQCREDLPHQFENEHGTSTSDAHLLKPYLAATSLLWNWSSNSVWFTWNNNISFTTTTSKPWVWPVYITGHCTYCKPPSSGPMAILFTRLLGNFELWCHMAYSSCKADVGPPRVWHNSFADSVLQVQTSTIFHYSFSSVASCIPSTCHSGLWMQHNGKQTQGENCDASVDIVHSAAHAVP